MSAFCDESGFEAVGAADHEAHRRAAIIAPAAKLTCARSSEPSMRAALVERNADVGGRDGVPQRFCLVGFAGIGGGGPRFGEFGDVEAGQRQRLATGPGAIEIAGTSSRSGPCFMRPMAAM